MELQQWKDFTKPYHFTKSDLLQLKQGDVVKFLVMDRNLEDITERVNSPRTITRPENFFKENWAYYKHDKYTFGKLHWNYGDTNDFEFEIEFKDDFWCPLCEGYLDFDSGRTNTHWNIYPLSTRMGFRGPMILWEHLKSLPSVFWEEILVDDDI